MGSDFGTIESGRRHTDDFERMIPNHQTRADSRETSTELALPERITQDDGGRRAASQVVFRAEQPSGGGRNAERGKEFTGHSEHGYGARFGAPPDS
jgi:hypothetical protein